MAEEEERALKEDGRARIYRALTARLNYLGQDRTDIQYAVKELSRKMSCPNEEDFGKI